MKLDLGLFDDCSIIYILQKWGQRVQPVGLWPMAGAAGN